jgi:hypothetical protein
MAILRKLKRILTKEFPVPDKVQLEDYKKSVYGSIRSERFKRMDSMDRHDGSPRLDSQNTRRPSDA